MCILVIDFSWLVAVWGWQCLWVLQGISSPLHQWVQGAQIWSKEFVRSARRGSGWCQKFLIILSSFISTAPITWIVVEWTLDFPFCEAAATWQDVCGLDYNFTKILSVKNLRECPLIAIAGSGEAVVWREQCGRGTFAGNTYCSCLLLAHICDFKEE